MRKVIVFLSLMSISTPVLACDMHGMPGFGGMNRFNPFPAMHAGPQQAEPVVSRQDQPEPAVETDALPQTAPAEDARKIEVEDGTTPVPADEKTAVS